MLHLGAPRKHFGIITRLLAERGSASLMRDIERGRPFFRFTSFWSSRRLTDRGIWEEAIEPREYERIKETRTKVWAAEKALAQKSNSEIRGGDARHELLTLARAYQEFRFSWNTALLAYEAQRIGANLEKGDPLAREHKKVSEASNALAIIGANYNNERAQQILENGLEELRGVHKIEAERREGLKQFASERRRAFDEFMRAQRSYVDLTCKD